MLKDKSKKDDLSLLTEEQVSEIYEILENYSLKKKSEYVAFVSYKKTIKKNKKDKFKYRYFKLKPNKKDLENSGDEKIFYYHFFVDPESEEIYQIFSALVPKTIEQLNSVRSWGIN